MSKQAAIEAFFNQNQGTFLKNLPRTDATTLTFEKKRVAIEIWTSLKSCIISFHAATEKKATLLKRPRKELSHSERQLLAETSIDIESAVYKFADALNRLTQEFNIQFTNPLLDFYFWGTDSGKNQAYVVSDNGKKANVVAPDSVDLFRVILGPAKFDETLSGGPRIVFTEEKEGEPSYLLKCLLFPGAQAAVTPPTTLNLPDCSALLWSGMSVLFAKRAIHAINQAKKLQLRPPKVSGYFPIQIDRDSNFWLYENILAARSDIKINFFCYDESTAQWKETSFEAYTISRRNPLVATSPTLTETKQIAANGTLASIEKKDHKDQPYYQQDDALSIKKLRHTAQLWLATVKNKDRYRELSVVLGGLNSYQATQVNYSYHNMSEEALSDEKKVKLLESQLSQIWQQPTDFQSKSSQSRVIFIANYYHKTATRQAPQLKKETVFPPTIKVLNEQYSSRQLNEKQLPNHLIPLLRLLRHAKMAHQHQFIIDLYKQKFSLFFKIPQARHMVIWALNRKAETILLATSQLDDTQRSHKEKKDHLFKKAINALRLSKTIETESLQSFHKNSQTVTLQFESARRLEICAHFNIKENEIAEPTAAMTVKPMTPTSTTDNGNHHHLRSLAAAAPVTAATSGHSDTTVDESDEEVMRAHSESPSQEHIPVLGRSNSQTHLVRLPSDDLMPAQATLSKPTEEKALKVYELLLRKHADPASGLRYLILANSSDPLSVSPRELYINAEFIYNTVLICGIEDCDEPQILLAGYLASLVLKDPSKTDRIVKRLSELNLKNGELNLLSRQKVHSVELKQQAQPANSLRSTAPFTFETKVTAVKDTLSFKALQKNQEKKIYLQAEKRKKESSDVSMQFHRQTYDYSGALSNETGQMRGGNVQFGGVLPQQLINKDDIHIFKTLVTKKRIGDLIPPKEVLEKLISHIPSGLPIPKQYFEKMIAYFYTNPQPNNLLEMKLSDFKHDQYKIVLETMMHIVAMNFQSTDDNYEADKAGYRGLDYATSALKRLMGSSTSYKDSSLDTATSLSVMYAMQVGDCRHHAQGTQLLFDIWKREKLIHSLSRHCHSGVFAANTLLNPIPYEDNDCFKTLSHCHLRIIDTLRDPETDSPYAHTFNILEERQAGAPTYTIYDGFALGQKIEQLSPDLDPEKRVVFETTRQVDLSTEQRHKYETASYTGAKGSTRPSATGVSLMGRSGIKTGSVLEAITTPETRANTQNQISKLAFSEEHKQRREINLSDLFTMIVKKGFVFRHDSRTLQPLKAIKTDNEALVMQYLMEEHREDYKKALTEAPLRISYYIFELFTQTALHQHKIDALEKKYNTKGLLTPQEKLILDQLNYQIPHDLAMKNQLITFVKEELKKPALKDNKEKAKVLNALLIKLENKNFKIYPSDLLAFRVEEPKAAVKARHTSAPLATATQPGQKNWGANVTATTSARLMKHQRPQKLPSNNLLVAFVIRQQNQTTSAASATAAPII